VTKLKHLLDKRHWQQAENVMHWRRRAEEALNRLAVPPRAADYDEFDVSVENVRVASETELVDEVITHRLLEEGLAPSEEEEEAADAVDKRGSHPRPRPWINEEDRKVIGALGVALAESIEQRRKAEDGAVEEIRSRRVGRRGNGSGKGEPEAEGRTNAGTVMQHIRQLRQSRATTASAQLLRHASISQLDFNASNHQDIFCIYQNAAELEPHRNWVERITNRYRAKGAVLGVDKGGGYLSDVAQLPAEVRRLAADEVIITVVVCNKLGHRDQEFDILASQRLYELRDSFYFASDWMFDGPTRITSATFFIDGIFYSDRRDPAALDYSTEIIEWLQNTRDPGFLRRTSSLSMDVRLCDLDRIPLGERCIYIHQGDIERSVYFTNMRLAHAASNCPFTEAYPMLLYMRKVHKRRCYACCQNYAMWLILDSSRCPHNPSFWCDYCFTHFFKDTQGEFLRPVDYKIFPYLHDES